VPWSAGYITNMFDSEFSAHTGQAQRLQIEYLKPEIILTEQGVDHTIVPNAMRSTWCALLQTLS
jgi:hypothetical protein